MCWQKDEKNLSKAYTHRFIHLSIHCYCVHIWQNQPSRAKRRDTQTIYVTECRAEWLKGRKTFLLDAYNIQTSETLLKKIHVYHLLDKCNNILYASFYTHISSLYIIFYTYSFFSITQKNYRLKW